MNWTLRITLCLSLLAAGIWGLVRLRRFSNEWPLGIEVHGNYLRVPRPFWLGMSRISFADIESIDLVPTWSLLPPICIFRYGFSTDWVGRRLKKNAIVLTLRSPPCFQRYLFLTPADPNTAFMKLKGQLAEHAQSNDLSE
jgi:hypothetical protein